MVLRAKYCSVVVRIFMAMCQCISKYSVTPIIRINWDRKPSGYADLSLKIDNSGSLKWKKIYKRLFLGYIFIYAQIKH
jgi:hypothetical protein